MVKKAIFSLVISAFLIGGIAVLSHTGIIDLIENRFFNPAACEALVRETTSDAKLLSGILSRLQEDFLSLLSAPSLRRSFLPGRSAADIDERNRIIYALLKSVPALHSVCFMDSSGKQMLSFPADIASLPLDEVYVPAHEQARFVLDKAADRIIFTFPFYDSLEFYRGFALFSVSARVLTDAFSAEGKMGFGENLALVANPAGVVYGFPGIPAEEIISGVSAAWTEGYRSLIPLASSGAGLMLVSACMDQGFYYGRIYNEAVLIFPQPVKILVPVTGFLTIFLIIFFLFNLKRVSPASGEIITEHNGIHFVNAKVVEDGESSGKEIDNDFVNLVESVVGKK